MPPGPDSSSLDGLVVTTVLGDVPASSLGVTLPHEHLLGDATSQWSPPADPGQLRDRVQPFTTALRGRVQLDPFSYRDAMRQQDLAAAEAELRAFAACGRSTVVDLGDSGYGRDAAGLQILARLTGVNVVMGCGEYVSFGHNPYVRQARPGPGPHRAAADPARGGLPGPDPAQPRYGDEAAPAVNPQETHWR